METTKIKFTTLGDLIENEISAIYKEFGCFYAFGKKQFDEGSVKGVEYFADRSGLLIPKENYDKFFEKFEKAYDNGVKKHFKMFGAERIIEHEYFNHETQLTMNINKLIDGVLSIYSEFFPNDFSEEKIRKISKKCFQKAVKNNWF